MYPDKRLFGKEPGEALNEHFYARSWVNTALVGYPPELEPVLGVDPSELKEIDNILGPIIGVYAIVHLLPKRPLSNMPSAAIKMSP